MDEQLGRTKMMKIDQVFLRIFAESSGVKPSARILHPGTSYVCMTAGVQVDAMLQ